ncbi:MAG TPA: tetratricopeptide repeat protein, partial [Steroidobacteraceae bacterium]
MTATATAQVTSTIESEVARIHALIMERRFGEGVAAATAVLCQVPENRDVLYLLALGQRQLIRTADALATLEQLERFHPGYSRLYQERGHCYVAMKDAPKAIEAFLQAVAINPALPASWGMLEGLYRMCGDADNSGKAAAHVAKLKTLPQEVITATGLLSDGDPVAAEKIIRPFLLANGDHIEAMRLLARIGTALEVFDDAELLLEAVLERAPDYVAARRDYATVLLGRHKYQQALAELDKLLGADPANRQYLTLYATATVGLGDHARAVALYQDLLRDAPPRSPGAAELHLSLAHSLKTLGRRTEAVDEYRAAARELSDFGDAYWSLANLKTYRFTDAELVSMRAAEAAPLTRSIDRCHLCFALGKAHEDRGEYSESWRYYKRGNELKRAESRYRPEVIELNTAKQKAVCTREFFEQRLRVGAASTAPIFVVGLPRSGSTLIEQILASHSAVEGTQELADIPRYVLELQGRERDLESPRYPAVLAQLPPAEFLRFADRYLDETRV